MRKEVVTTIVVLASAAFGPLVCAVVAARARGGFAFIAFAGALGGALTGLPVAAPGGVLGGALGGAVVGLIIGKLMHASGRAFVKAAVYAGIVYGVMVLWLDPGTLAGWFGINLEDTVLGRFIFNPLSRFGDSLSPIFSPALVVIFGMASGGMLMGSFGAFGATLGGDLGGMIGAGLAYTLIGGLSGALVGLISAGILSGILRGLLGGACAGLVIGVIMGVLNFAFTNALLGSFILALVYTGLGALAGWAALVRRRHTEAPR